MAAYTIRRLLGLIPVLLGISLLVFGVLRLIPGDPALLILGERATPDQRAALRTELGLDKPLFFNTDGGNFFDGQYFNFMADLVRGNFGTSIVRDTSVGGELRGRFPATLELTIASLFLATVIGVPAGMIAAMRRGSAIDTTSVLFALVGVSIPIFWLGLLLQYIFGVNLQWFPISQRLDVEYTRNFQTITGLYVLDGKINRNDKVRVLRNGVVLHDGRLSSLKRFKDDVREVQAGYECGAVVESFTDVQNNDTLEFYRIEQVVRTA